MTQAQKPNTEGRRPAEQDPSGRSIYRGIWRNWFILASVLVLTTVGLATALPPLLNERLDSPWPWMKTELVLLLGLSVTIVMFVAYMTQQQRRVIAIHRDLTILREEANKRIRQHTSRLFALSNISHMISIETNLQNIFDRLTQMCAETFNCYRASLMLHDADTNELVVRSVHDNSDFTILNLRQRVGEGIAGYAAQRREPILLSGPADYARYPGLELKDPSLTSAMVVPIIVRDELVGVLNVSSRSKEVIYDENDLLALQGFGSSAGACIRHTEQVSWMRRMVPQLGEQPPAEKTPQDRWTRIDVRSR